MYTLETEHMMYIRLAAEQQRFIEIRDMIHKRKLFNKRESSSIKTFLVSRARYGVHPLQTHALRKLLLGLYAGANIFLHCL